MIQVSISRASLDGLDELIAQVRDVEYRVLDLVPLGREVGDILEVDNLEARMLGVDKDNQDFAPLQPATWKKRLGSGPPLAPLETQSRIISDFTIDVRDMGPGAVDVVGSWPNMPFLGFHVTGTRYMASRDPVGIRPQAVAQIEEAFDAFLEVLFQTPGY